MLGDYPVNLHRDPWMIQRISQALDAIRYADQEGLETELDLLAFAEDILSHYDASNSNKENSND